MNTIKTLGFTGAAMVAVALLAPYISVAEMSPTATPGDAGSSSTVHRVSHSLAGTESYTSNGPSGYKWGRKVEQPAPSAASANWSTSTTPHSGYKWGDSSASEPAASTYAGTASYSWGVKNYADQAGYRWGVKSYTDQAGYRWGVKNYADQAGYRWGVKNYADQAGYRWGVKSYADQAGYRWGVKSYADQTGYRWSVKSYADQVGYRWGVK